MDAPLVQEKGAQLLASSFDLISLSLVQHLPPIPRKSSSERREAQDDEAGMAGEKAINASQKKEGGGSPCLRDPALVIADNITTYDMSGVFCYTKSSVVREIKVDLGC